jgi:hypothetical protein
VDILRISVHGATCGVCVTEMGWGNMVTKSNKSGKSTSDCPITQRREAECLPVTEPSIRTSYPMSMTWPTSKLSTHCLIPPTLSSLMRPQIGPTTLRYVERSAAGSVDHRRGYHRPLLSLLGQLAAHHQYQHHHCRLPYGLESGLADPPLADYRLGGSGTLTSGPGTYAQLKTGAPQRAGLFLPTV